MEFIHFLASWTERAASDGSPAEVSTRLVTTVLHQREPGLLGKMAEFQS